MCLFEYVLGIEHDSVDPCHLLENHQHDADHQGLVDAGVMQVGHMEAGALRDETAESQRGGRET